MTNYLQHPFRYQMKHTVPNTNVQDGKQSYSKIMRQIIVSLRSRHYVISILITHQPSIKRHLFCKLINYVAPEVSDGCSFDNLEVSAIHNPNNTRNNDFKEFNLICWNCRDIGHRYQDCPKDFLEIFCFGCGYRGVRKPHCYTCKKRASENPKPNVMYKGMMLRSEQSILRPSSNQQDAASNTEPHNKFK